MRKKYFSRYVVVLLFGLSTCFAWSQNEPTFTSTPATMVNVGETYAYAISTEYEGVDGVIITAPILPAWLTLTSAGAGLNTFAGSGVTPANNAGIYDSPDGTAAASANLNLFSSGNGLHATDGKIFFSDVEEFGVRYLDENKQVQTFYAGDGNYLSLNASAIQYDADANTSYIGDYGKHKIVKSVNGGALQDVATNINVYVFSLLLDKVNNKLYAGTRGAIFEIDLTNSDPASNSTVIVGISGSNGGYSDTGIASTSQVNQVSSMAFDNAGQLIFVDRLNKLVRKVNLQNDTIETIAGTQGSSASAGDGAYAVNATFQDPAGLAVHPNGNIYITERLAKKVRVINPDGIISEFASVTSGGFLASLTISENNTLYIGTNNQVFELNTDATLNGVPTNADVGIHPVQLRVEDDYYGYDFTTQDFNIKVNAPFVTTWEVSADDLSIYIPTQGGLEVTDYDFSIDWGDGSTELITGDDPDPVHTYGAAGTYTVKISGIFPHMKHAFFGTDPVNAAKIRSIEQWGSIQWERMDSMFTKASNLVYNATDAPDLTNATSLTAMFVSATNFNGAIGNWDVSNITSMQDMFSNATSFNQDLNNWDVSNVTTMLRMFINASSFNGNIGNWEVLNVTDMQEMFNGATAFNQDLNNWDVSGVTSMRRMFINASSFNGNIGDWEVLNVTNMQEMFDFATAFNQDLNNWDVSNVTSMLGMFNNATSFNGNIGSWNVSSVTNMDDMFEGAEAFNQDLNGWDVSAVTTMQDMFRYAVVFNGNISDWNVSSVEDMDDMFEGAVAFNQDIGSWNVAKVTDMNNMFRDATAFNQDLNNWNVSNVTNMYGMFRRAGFNANITSWDVSSVTDMGDMFYNNLVFNQDISNWNVANVTSVTSVLRGAVAFSQDNYDALLLGWSQLNLQPGLEDFILSTTYSCTGAAARQAIIDDFGWEIIDEGFNFPLPSFVLDANNQAGITEAMLTANCGDYVVSASPNSFNCANLGSNEIAIDITDNLGNNTVETINVSIVDNSAPVLDTQDITVVLDDNNDAMVMIDEVITAITDNCSTEFSSFFNTGSGIVSDLSRVYAFGFEDWYNTGDNIDYSTLHSYIFNQSTNTIANPSLVFNVNEFDNNLENGYWPIAFDQNPITGTGYFIVGDGPRHLLTYNFGTQEVTNTGVNIDGNAADMTFDQFGVAYVWIGNNIKTLDLATGVTSTLVAVTQSGGGKGLTYDYDKHRLILASGGNSNSVQISIGAVDLATSTYTILTQVDAPASNTETGDYSTFQGIEYIGNNNYLVSGGWWSYMFGVLTLETLEDGSTQHSFNVTVPDTYAMNPNQPGLKDLFVPYSIGKSASISFEGCEAIGEYTYEVETKDASGNSTTANVTITVVEETPPTAVTKDITIDLAGGASISITPLDIVESYEDNCSDIEAIVLSLNTDTFTEPGTYTVTLTAQDASGNSAEFTAEVTVEDTTLSTPDFETAQVRVYPNPATSQITIEAKGINISEITIYDFVGKIVKISQSSVVNISGLSSGVYIVRLRDDSGNVVSKKLVKE